MKFILSVKTELSLCYFILRKKVIWEDRSILILINYEDDSKYSHAKLNVD
jgi:hypothetical protein